MWIRSVQSIYVDNRKYDQLKAQLGVFLTDENILRCQGRLKHSSLPYSQKFPALLPPDSRLTELIILQCHEKVFHNKTLETLNELRSRFWVVRGRQVVRKIIHRCVVCRKVEGKPFATSVSAPSPEFRLNSEISAFQSVGLDYCGPVYLKDSTRNASSKAWISIFSCCTSRAIHIELVPDLTTNAFIRALKRFTGRRGSPSLIISDNARTFTSAYRVLSSLCKLAEVQSFLASKKINWHFILQKSPSHGGFYERMVQSVKRNLRKTLKNAQLNYEELTTVLAEVEAIINSRPLTYMYSDNINEALSPSHLIFGKRLLTLPDNIVYPEEIDDTPELFNKRMKYLITLQKRFWKQWSTTYLNELREHHKNREGTSVCREIQEGELITVQEDNLPRGQWKMGVIQRTLRGEDGVVRGAEIKIVTKSGETSLLRRPVSVRGKKYFYRFERNSK